MSVASMMLPLGTAAPPFALRDVVSGQVYSLDSYVGKAALLVMFLCRHCPHVEHVQHEIAKIGQDYQETGLGTIGISSNDPVHYPDDAPERLKDMAQQLTFHFPLCFDDSQEVPRPTRLSAHRTSISLMPNGDWSTGGSSTTVAQATRSRSPAAIFVQRSMRC